MGSFVARLMRPSEGSLFEGFKAKHTHFCYLLRKFKFTYLVPILLTFDLFVVLAERATGSVFCSYVEINLNVLQHCYILVVYNKQYFVHTM